MAFVAVALSGRKPAYHGLVAILTFAAYVEVLRQALVVPLMLTLHSTDVETSLAVLLRGRAEASGWLYASLQAVDPFAIWFCALAAEALRRVGREVLRKLEVGTNLIGNHVQIAGQRFRVVGILKAKGSFFGESQDDTVLIPFTTGLRLFPEARPRLGIHSDNSRSPQAPL